MNWGDVVRAVAPGDNEWPRFVEVVRRSGHRTIHLFFYKDTEEKYRSDVLSRLKEWKANYENGDGKLYAVDIQPDGDLEGLFGYLEKLETAKVDYRDEVSPIKS